MGKDWLYWGGSNSNSSSSTKAGGSGGRSTKKGRVEGNHTASGCMNAVFQLFDFHHFQFPLHHQRQDRRLSSLTLSSQKNPSEEKFRHGVSENNAGVEAPRNSLEMEEAFASFPSSTMKGEESFNIPMGIQVKTRTDDLSSEFSTSPGSKTPNLVARLMGLDVLPPADTCSTSSSSSTCVRPSKSRPQMGQSRSSRVGARHLFDTDIIGTRSLPETPRISSARRSDVEYHHRLSLQINKEIAGATDDLSAMKGIVKQVKEKVSRRAGLDITNTTETERPEEETTMMVMIMWFYLKHMEDLTLFHRKGAHRSYLEYEPAPVHSEANLSTSGRNPGGDFEALREFKPMGILGSVRSFDSWVGVNRENMRENQKLPVGDCQVLEDIDALIETDLGRSELRGAVALEEEGEAIVAELEEDLVESLVHEMTMGAL
ncbi:hypothetical protein C3L33_03158, partial [Rhododendron williamsianum]